MLMLLLVVACSLPGHLFSPAERPQRGVRVGGRRLNASVALDAALGRLFLLNCITRLCPASQLLRSNFARVHLHRHADPSSAQSVNVPLLVHSGYAILGITVEHDRPAVTNRPAASPHKALCKNTVAHKVYLLINPFLLSGKALFLFLLRVRFHPVYSMSSPITSSECPQLIL
ncbi:hypothetical protein, conserved in T. vivax [Trypanosoma vivax Y486]|uniref:Secreted protein n=1 Tax=Trypanosoma vivax (strain Y486) TaxID=1055687 RepID=F9WLE0_TRYVY|nr:hypothetical protein, conserved in T. vivax [Trypanosoma vivax Y486]|eukprot:CCD18331.1 hypothetical protein, conserved in T. vivax [Trypanosoma vivax Y486]